MLTPIFFLFQGSALGITAGATPGTLQTYLITETLSGGWRRSLPLIFVPILSDTPIIILTTFLLGQMPEVMLRVISLAGGLFVWYLAWGLWQQWHRNIDPKVEIAANTPPRNFWKAVAMNLLNPNPYIFWTFVIGPLLISAIEQSWWHALAFLLGFYGVFMGTMIGFIALFHQTRRLGPRVIRSIQLVSILILVTFGGILIKEGIIT
jgi:threonine/homoserine/homoserine lactone efflux protein